MKIQDAVEIVKHSKQKFTPLSCIEYDDSFDFLVVGSEGPIGNGSTYRVDKITGKVAWVSMYEQRRKNKKIVRIHSNLAKEAV